ncbi:MAG: hypothetical protein Fur0022_34810 [Anaerolineales bacterium]
MGVSLIFVMGVVGLGVAAVLIAVVAVIALSRRDDFVNPFSSGKTAVKNKMPVDLPKNIAPPVFQQPKTDQEAALVDWLIEQASAQTGVMLAHDPIVRDRMLNAVRIALQELKEQEATKISLPFLTADPSGPKHFELRFTRQMADQVR